MNEHDTSAGSATMPGATGPDPCLDRDMALQRPVHGRMVAGVAAGLARYLDVDPVLVRIAIVVLAFLGGMGVLVYAAAWLLMPEEGAPESVGEHWLAHLTEGRP